jgi:hypothetical protein
VDRNAIQEILGDLETRLEAYLVEWRGELGLRGVSEAGIDRTERLPAAPGREKEGVEPPVPKPRVQASTLRRDRAGTSPPDR